MPILISVLGLCSFGELVIERSPSNIRPKTTLYSWSDRSRCMCDTDAGIQSLPRVQRGDHRMAGSGCGIRRFDCYHSNLVIGRDYLIFLRSLPRTRYRPSWRRGSRILMIRSLRLFDVGELRTIRCFFYWFHTVTVHTGLLTAIMALSDLVVFLAVPVCFPPVPLNYSCTDTRSTFEKTTLNFIWDLPMAKVYVISLLST